MSPIRVFFALASLAGVAVAHAIVGPDDIYQESGGMVVMEAENTPSALGTGADRWELYTPGEANYVDGATGGAHLEFQGDYPNGATTPKTPLTYKFKINAGGTYQLHIRSRARLDGAPDDKNNDCYVKLTGLNGSTFDDGPNAGGEHMDDALKSLLTSSTKIYVNSPTSWGWANLLDAGGSSNKRWPVYQFPAGGTYEFSLGGRSGKYNFDRIIFRKVSIPDTAAKSVAIPESPLNSSGSTTPAISRIMLVNADTDDDAGVLSNGGTINLAPMGPNLSLRADTTPPVIGSVRFTLDGTELRTETQTPYSIGGDNIWDDYLPWTPTAGSHTLTVTPFSTTGAAGTPVTVNFTVSNQAVAGSPVANAGVDKTITLPATTVSLSGSGTDSGGSIAGYKWDQVSGPMPVAWSSSIAASPTLNDLVHGTYKFRLTVTDNSGLSGYDDMTVTVLPASNAPVVNAGVDKTVTLPAASATLSGTSSDPRNALFAHLWTQLSGPSNSTRAGESSLNLTASNLIAGTYVFRLRAYSEASDVMVVGADDVVVHVTAAAGAPVANAGVDKAITLPTNSVTLNGSGTDTGGPISSYAWMQVSGPGTAGLSGNTSANLTASALIAGSYVFRLTVTDNSGLTGSDDVAVVVSAASSGAPVANADADKTVTLPTSSVVLNGSGTDSGGSISSYAWTQVSGPNTAARSNAATATLTASGLVQGGYVFRLTVTDNSGLTASDDVIVTVNPAAGSSGQVLTALMLVNADTDQDLGPMSTGMSIDLAVTPNISVRADTSPAPVGSVRFSYDDIVNLRTESGPPYTINGDLNQSDYLPWPVTPGTHTLTGTPFTEAAGTGTAGTPLTVVFNVIDSAASGVPVVNAGGDKTIVQPASSVTLNGTATDSDGSIASHLWTQVSGPGTATLSGSATGNLTASNLVEGTYLFRYRATDNAANSASDEVSVFVLPDSGGEALLSGELKKWHKVTLSFNGPTTSETATPNPFTDYRLNVTFSHPGSGKSYVVPGYFAADGNAADSSAGSGNVWRAHFAPDETGLWVYTASFRSGANVATSTIAGASAGYFDEDTGNFTIAATDKTGVDFRGKGRLEYVGKHHLRFAETGEYFMKAGVDAPENLLAYSDFDGDFKTDGQGDAYLKTWGPHAGDWQSGDPSWGGGKGKGLIGAINYLASEGLNAFSFLTFNVGGDDKNVFPYTTYGERSRMDVSKLDQWEMVFEHGTRKGMHLNFKTQETENETTLDGGDTGNQRKLYYRELIARFGHHPGLNWNLGEEINAASATQKKAWAQYFYDTDPYRHPIVIHNGSNHYELLGSASKLTGFSLQLNASDFTDMFSMTKDYIDRSEDAGRPWVVACDEPGDSRLALRTDADPGSSHTDARKNAIWGNIMAGGAGVEFYFGYDTAHSDLTCQDFRSRESFWDYCRHALEFLEGNNIPFEQMSNRNSLVSGYGNNANRCLAKTGDTYLVQLHGGGTHTLNLSGVSGSYTVKWFNPRSGGPLINGPTVDGGGTVSLGAPPNTTTQDWIALVRSTTAGGATNTAPVVNAGQDASGFLNNGTAQVLLSGSVTDDGLPDPLALTKNWSFVSGPAAVSFSSATTASTTATFTALGSYLLRFSASDSLLSSSDQVTVTIGAPSGGNRPPVFPGYSALTPANNALMLSYPLVLGGASDPDGDTLSPVIASGSTSAGGYVAMDSGMLTYTPPPDFSGTDSFALTIEDGRGGSATGNLVITVQPEDGVTGLAPPVIERIAGNQQQVRFHGVPGVEYSFQRSVNLTQWTTLETKTAGATGVVEFIDSAPPSPRAYYRLTGR